MSSKILTLRWVGAASMFLCFIMVMSQMQPRVPPDVQARAGLVMPAPGPTIPVGPRPTVVMVEPEESIDSLDLPQLSRDSEGATRLVVPRARSPPAQSCDAKRAVSGILWPGAPDLRRRPPYEVASGVLILGISKISHGLFLRYQFRSASTASFNVLQRMTVSELCFSSDSSSGRRCAGTTTVVKPRR